MHYCDWTFPTPAENLACDEALLDLCDEGAVDAVLRVWEPGSHFVVLGYANRLAASVDAAACRARAIPILRRCSGGGTVVQGPGCLNYSLILRQDSAGPWASLSGTTLAVLQRHSRAFQDLLGPDVSFQGTSDLVLGERKFSGNAQRRKRHALLFHGTFLLALDLPLVSALLPMPEQQPAYRHRRPHAEFLTNLHVPAHLIKEALQSSWQAAPGPLQPPVERIRRLTDARYATDEWNARY